MASPRKRCWFSGADFTRPRDLKQDKDDDDTVSTCSASSVSYDDEDDITLQVRPKKRVRLDLSSSPASVPGQSLSQSEKEATWWRREELSHLKRKGYQQAVATSNKFASDLHQVYTAASTVAEANLSSNPSKACGNKPMAACAPALFRLGCSGTRGLETVAYPQRSRDRQAAIRSVLDAQRQCTTQEASEQQRSGYLAAVSCFHSERAAVLAKVMAKADAAIARKL